MNFGKLDRRLTLQAPAAVAQNEYGETVPDQWVDIATVAVRVEYPQGTEATDAAQLVGVQPAKFTMRYRADVQETWRGVLDDKIFAFTAVAEITRRVGLLVSAVRRGSVSPPLVVAPLHEGYNYPYPYAYS